MYSSHMNAHRSLRVKMLPNCTTVVTAFVYDILTGPIYIFYYSLLLNQLGGYTNNY